MARVGRRFVPQSTIERRVQAKDDRYAEELRRRFPPVVDVALVPKEPGNNGIVIEMILAPVETIAGNGEASRANHKTFPKPSTKLDRAIKGKAARLLDAQKLRAWARAVKETGSLERPEDRRPRATVYRTRPP
jgi:hypothetical protein